METTQRCGKQAAELVSCHRLTKTRLLLEALCSAAYVVLQYVIDGEDDASEHPGMQYCTQVIKMLEELETRHAGNVVTALLRELQPDLELAQPATDRIAQRTKKAVRG